MPTRARHRKTLNISSLVFLIAAMAALLPVLARAGLARADATGPWLAAAALAGAIGLFWVRRPKRVDWNAYGPRWPAITSLVCAALGVGINSTWLAAVGAIAFVAIVVRSAISEMTWAKLTPVVLLAIMAVPLPQRVGAQFTEWLEGGSARAASAVLDKLDVNQLVTIRTIQFGVGEIAADFSTGLNSLFFAAVFAVLLSIWNSDRLVRTLVLLAAACWSCFLAGLVRMIATAYFTTNESAVLPEVALDLLQFGVFVVLLLSARQAIVFLWSPITGRHRAEGVLGKFWNRLTAGDDTLIHETDLSASTSSSRTTVDELRLPIFTAALVAFAIWQVGARLIAPVDSAGHALLFDLPDPEAPSSTVNGPQPIDWVPLDSLDTASDDNDVSRRTYQAGNMHVQISLEKFDPNEHELLPGWHTLESQDGWIFDASVRGEYDKRVLAGPTGEFAYLFVRDVDANGRPLPARASWVKRPLINAINDGRRSAIGRFLGTTSASPYRSVRFLATSPTAIDIESQSELENRFRSYLSQLAQKFSSSEGERS